VPWPHQDEAVARPQATPSARRRRRSSSIRQWLPTIVFAGIVGLLVILLVAVRMLLASAAPSQSNVPAAAAAQPEPQTQVQAQPGQQPREALAPPSAQNPAPPAQPTSAIRFEARPIEPSYTVASGDNLSSIALKNRTSVEALQSINNLPDRATLKIGQRLVLP
jgi:LysM repeat protein